MNRGERTVPERFLKNVVWWVTEGGYCIPDPFNVNHYIKVEFSNNALCWAEVCLLDRTGDWDPEGPQWEIFCPATAELGGDIYLTELTAEELCHITGASKAQRLILAHQHLQKQVKTQQPVSQNKFESYLQNHQEQESKD